MTAGSRSFPEPHDFFSPRIASHCARTEPDEPDRLRPATAAHRHGGGRRRRAWAACWPLSRMPVDIFPNLNLPVIYVAQPYGGMDPAQMEGLLTNYYEYHFLYIGGIHHVESRNIQGMALMKLFFHPGTNMAQAMAETIGYVTRSRAFMPPGTVSPFITRFDAGSVPGRLPRPVERDQDDRRDPGPGAVQGPADVRQPARASRPRRRSAATSGPWSSGSTPTGSAPTRCRPTRSITALTAGQHDQPLGERPDRRQDADRPDQLAGPAGQGPGDDPDPDRRRTPASTSATSPPSRTPPTSPPATPWSTAAGPSTSS